MNNQMSQSEKIKIQNAIDENMRKLKTIKNMHSVDCGAPKIKRTYTYKDSSQF